MRENRFLHISDLHFFKSNHLKSSKDGINHYQIKCCILDCISSIITNQQIGAIIISGDLELDSTENLLPYLHKWVELGSKVFITFGEHDTKVSREKLIAGTRNLPGLYIFEEPKIIDDESLSFCVYGMSCESKQEGFLQNFYNLSNYTQKKPAIFLTHPCELPKHKARQLGYKYYAVGHIHKPLIINIDENTHIGRPGHLYSLWDGDGKAWPTGYIIGEFIGNNLNLSWIGFPIAQTVRLFIDPFKQKNSKALMVIENCPLDQSVKISEILAGEWQDQKYRGVFKGYVDLASDGLVKLVKDILNVFIDDIFVTPSDSYGMKKKYGYSRGVFSAKTLLSDEDIFKEFFDRIKKASNKTQ